MAKFKRIDTGEVVNVVSWGAKLTQTTTTAKVSFTTPTLTDTIILRK